MDGDLSLIEKCFPGRPTRGTLRCVPEQVPSNVLATYPIDVLLACHLNVTKPNDGFDPATDKTPLWCDWLRHAKPQHLPTVVIQLWPAKMLEYQESGPCSKFARKFLEKRFGYHLIYKLLRNTRLGGVVDTDYLMVVGFRGPLYPDEDLIVNILTEDLPTRPMSNCLRPFGAGFCARTVPNGVDAIRVPNAMTDPMPARAGAWIHSSDGFRRLHADEIGRGIGLSKEWLSHSHLPSKVLCKTPSLHVLERLGEVLAVSCANVVSETNETHAHINEEPQPPPKQAVKGDGLILEDSPGEFTWTVPDLRPNKGWYRRRLSNLKAAIKSFSERKRQELMDKSKLSWTALKVQMLADGREDLKLGTC